MRPASAYGERMRASLVIALAIATVVGGGCLFGDDAATEPADEATQESLREAYSALESAARRAPTVRLPRLEGEVEVVGKGEVLESSRPQDLGLVDYLGNRGISFSMALIKDEGERGLALAGIEFTGAANSIVLIAPRELRYGSARELLAGGAAFAAMSPTGTIYCIDDAEMGVEPCPAPDQPDPK